MTEMSGSKTELEMAMIDLHESRRERQRTPFLLLLLIVPIVLAVIACSHLATLALVPDRVPESGLSNSNASYESWDGMSALNLDVEALATGAAIDSYYQAKSENSPTTTPIEDVLPLEDEVTATVTASPTPTATSTSHVPSATPRTTATAKATASATMAETAESTLEASVTPQPAASSTSVPTLIPSVVPTLPPTAAPTSTTLPTATSGPPTSTPLPTATFTPACGINTGNGNCPNPKETPNP
jgi:hypothetical protein